MRKSYFFLILLFLSSTATFYSQTFSTPIVMAYFPSWDETYADSGKNSKLREVPSYVNMIFLAFAKPDLQYVKGSMDISKTGIEVPYDGCALKESISVLKAKGTKVVLSVGGETFWTDPNIYSKINYAQIKDLVDDLGLAGIDWDFEPNGSFDTIGNAANVQNFIDFFTKSRAVMPKSSGYILACAPGGAGALGGSNNNDTASPYAYSKRNTLTGESDTNLYKFDVPTNGINLFGYTSTGHMIPVIKSVGAMIDVIAFQGYNIGASTNRQLMYDSYAYYAEIYGFKVAAGVHYPAEPWGPYYTYNHQNVADLSSHIKNYTSRVGDKDGIMIWELLLSGSGSSSYSYLNVASKVLNGTAVATAVATANDYKMSPYSSTATFACTSTGGPQKYCGVTEYVTTKSYPTPNTQVYYNLKIWKNAYWANPDEYPGKIAGQWTSISACTTGPDKTLGIQENQALENATVYIDNATLHYNIANYDIDSIVIFDVNGKRVYHKTEPSNTGTITMDHLAKGLYFVRLQIGKEVVVKKIIL
jgi:chitinase